MEKIVLAIDDNRDFLRILEDMLEDSGYKVISLADPSKAEEFIDKFKPDILIIDVFMPKRSGFNLLEDFKEKGLYKNIPKIFLTCLDDDIEKMTAKACGVSQYITKPFNPDELLRVIKRALNPAEGAK
jgi:DNA-binding response OmpR family regulator